MRVENLCALQAALLYFSPNTKYVNLIIFFDNAFNIIKKYIIREFYIGWVFVCIQKYTPKTLKILINLFSTQIG